MMNTIDTIAAIATPSGRGGVGIIRISGPSVRDMAVDILGSLPPPFKASHRLFKDADQETLDDGVAIFFPSPNSFTGEDVLELQGHGGQIVLDMVLKRCLELGSRIAKPGEFSERAFLNDKLDLTQAEAIADLIDSGSEQAARSALRSLQGEFSSSIDSLLIKMIEMRVYVEAALDFPEEEIDFLADKKVLERLQAIKDQLTEITYKAKQGSLLRSGLNLVIIGEPNAGKSSLLNALSGNDTAIVTDIAGTTRDVLHESINLDGMPIHLVDTAGLRDSDDPVEKIGIERAWKAVEKADIALLLLGDTHLSTKSDEIVKKLPDSLPLLIVQNKIDLNSKDAGKDGDMINISAKYNLGIDILKEELKERMGYQNNNEGIFIARRRHLQALERTQEFVDNAEMQLTEFNAGELMAEELRLAQDELSQITGKFTSDDLLGEIFSSFCIGK
ncbi:tRNA uridine-5-carboxymethylaminomethyl(34) synthesis GTPase MnmE [uncultured Cocleimonas sp.]|uniref:tRNA uridine-5-carboxymethylaminomethyl(34) synthesis GTPase MnmE n=1 Tax=uncultured Cocleimonas sp. TaxID=1051587 RepID=UPI0026145046|nr:tRNA uridine-5-carboxymethylaminomethyl(34) synthesis GTPase MnmE [uncultured Cocleimonas sp.]